MANEEQVKILLQGVEGWNAWRKENPEVRPDLNGAKLNGADLSRADLISADLSSADLSSANLIGANLIDADLSVAKLIGAFLRGANLSGAELIVTDLRRADLRRAELNVANLSGAFLSGADLSEASIGYTVFGNVDLSEVKGLETVEHGFPSTIGIDTIYKSKGNIPHKFLLDAGVPQDAIKHLLPLAGTANYYSCFISYSKDQAFTERLHADLQAKGVRCWFAPEDIKGGREIRDQLKQAINENDKLLLVLSEDSMNSDWVKMEIRETLQAEEKEGRKKLFPIRLVSSYETLKQWEFFDADTGRDLALEVTKYFIPDFSNWKDHDSYQKAFERLLRDLSETA